MFKKVKVLKIDVNREYCIIINFMQLNIIVNVRITIIFQIRINIASLLLYKYNYNCKPVQTITDNIF